MNVLVFLPLKAKSNQNSQQLTSPLLKNSHKPRVFPLTLFKLPNLFLQFKFFSRFLSPTPLRLLTKQLPFQEIPAAQLPAAKAAGKLPQLPATVPTDCSELVAQCVSAAF